MLLGSPVIFSELLEGVCSTEGAGRELTSIMPACDIEISIICLISLSKTEAGLDSLSEVFLRLFLLILDSLVALLFWAADRSPSDILRSVGACAPKASISVSSESPYSCTESVEGVLVTNLKLEFSAGLLKCCGSPEAPWFKLLLWLMDQRSFSCDDEAAALGPGEGGMIVVAGMSLSSLLLLADGTWEVEEVSVLRFRDREDLDFTIPDK